MSHDDDDIVLEDPPNRGRVHGRAGYTEYARIADKIKANPGTWVRLRKPFPSAGSSRALSARIRSGRSKAFAPEGAFDSLSRTIDGEYWVWAKYLGEAGE